MITAKREAAVRRRAARMARLTPDMIANITAKREAAILRKAAKEAARTKLLPVDLSDLNTDVTKSASSGRRWKTDRQAAKTCDPTSTTWPNDQSLSAADDSHRKAGWWAIDTVNPNAWQAGAGYMETTAADIVLTQEVKIPDGHLRLQAEQSARNAKWSLAIEPCNVSNLGGMSAGTAVAVRSFIGMSEAEAVTGTKHLHAQGHFCMKRVSAMGKGGVHCDTPYMFSMVGQGGSAPHAISTSWIQWPSHCPDS